MTKNIQTSAALLVGILCTGTVSSFSVPSKLSQPRRATPLFALTADEDTPKSIKAAKLPEEKPLLSDASSDTESKEESEALTGTINERLLAELKAAEEKEKYGPKSGVGKKLGLSGRAKKTPEEQEAALQEARNLNGVNPIVAITGGVFSFVVAAGLWYCTNQLGAFFALHPVETDLYFVQRLASLFRNVVMGIASLASGFFGVTGMGIFLLGVRVAIGVAKGELDPTPIKRKSVDELEMPNVWDLMMNKKPDRRGRRGGSNDNPFGL